MSSGETHDAYGDESDELVDVRRMLMTLPARAEFLTSGGVRK